jgi:hypothetical protein
VTHQLNDVSSSKSSVNFRSHDVHVCAAEEVESRERRRRHQAVLRKHALGNARVCCHLLVKQISIAGLRRGGGREVTLDAKACASDAKLLHLPREDGGDDRIDVHVIVTIRPQRRFPAVSIAEPAAET